MLLALDKYIPVRPFHQVNKHIIVLHFTVVTDNQPSFKPRVFYLFMRRRRGTLVTSGPGINSKGPSTRGQ